MDWLNYHHLLYFWTVAREGSIARAAEVLNLAQPTISTQIKSLESSLGTELLERRGRGLALTATGEMVSDVRNTLNTIKGCRPTSVTNQPATTATKPVGVMAMHHR